MGNGLSVDTPQSLDSATLAAGIDDGAERIVPWRQVRARHWHGDLRHRWFGARPQGLDVGHHVQFRKARNILRPHQLHMGQLMQAWPVAIDVARRFEAIERSADCLVADHVAMDLEAGRIEGNEQFAQMVLAEHHRRIAARFILVAIDHRRRAVLQHAIKEELGGMHLQHL